MDFYNKDIKPHLASFLLVAGGVYFLSPILLPKMASLPLIGNSSELTKQALLAGTYSASSVMIAQWVKSAV